MTLDDKLKKILNLYAQLDASELGEDKFIGHYSAKAAIAQIKQAFADEGYRYDPMTAINVAVREDGTIYATNPNAMTGQEWYSRFEKELIRHHHINFRPSDALIIAKKVIGIW